MRKPSQTESGKAFEYCVADELAKFLSIPFLDNSSKTIGYKAFQIHHLQEQYKLQRAADESSVFLCCHDDNFKLGLSVFLQTDKEGMMGDVRDVIVNLKGGNDIGISAKNRHDAIKHSRLSDKIDFGSKWADYPCSSHYMQRIAPIFEDLRKKGNDGLLFRQIPDKVNRYYLPVLTAFEDELRRLCEDYSSKFVKRVFQYLLGTNDFYKVMKENNHVAIQSCNINGTLNWGRKWRIPDRIDDISRKRNSTNTLIVTFTGGWQISFRLHNARSRVEPSLKFDIKFIGLLQTVARHVISI